MLGRLWHQNPHLNETPVILDIATRLGSPLDLIVQNEDRTVKVVVRGSQVSPGLDLTHRDALLVRK